MRLFMKSYTTATDTLAILGTVIVLTAGGLQVWFRYMTESSLIWSEELMRYTMLWLVMICGGRAYAAGQFLGMRGLVNILPQRITRTIDRISGSIMVGFLGVIAYYGALFAWKTRLQLSPTIEISLFWVHVAICVGPAILAVHILLQDVFGLKPETTEGKH